MMKIALVDDHKLFRKGIRSLLEELNDIEVVFEAANGQELLDQMAASPAERRRNRGEALKFCLIRKSGCNERDIDLKINSPWLLNHNNR